MEPEDNLRQLKAFCKVPATYPPFYDSGVEIGTSSAIPDECSRGSSFPYVGVSAASVIQEFLQMFELLGVCLLMDWFILGRSSMIEGLLLPWMN